MEFREALVENIMSEHFSEEQQVKKGDLLKIIFSNFIGSHFPGLRWKKILLADVLCAQEGEQDTSAHPTASVFLASLSFGHHLSLNCEFVCSGILVTHLKQLILLDFVICILFWFCRIFSISSLNFILQILPLYRRGHIFPLLFFLWTPVKEWASGIFKVHPNYSGSYII